MSGGSAFLKQKACKLPSRWSTKEKQPNARNSNRRRKSPLYYTDSRPDQGRPILQTPGTHYVMFEAERLRLESARINHVLYLSGKRPGRPPHVKKRDRTVRLLKVDSPRERTRRVFSTTAGVARRIARFREKPYHEQYHHYYCYHDY